MLLVCMKFVSCSILFLMLSILSYSMFMLCVLVCGLILGVQEVVGRRWRWGSDWESSPISSCQLRTWCG